MASPWAHSISVMRKAGWAKVICSCGDQSPKLYSNEEVDAWASRHTGVAVKKQGRR